MPVMFLAASIALFIGIQAFLDDGKVYPPKPPAAATEVESPVVAPPDQGSAKPASEAGLPVPAPDMPDLEKPEGTAPTADGAAEEKGPASPAVDALAVLEKFLKASTLEEREGLMETSIAKSELANTVLASPLPEFRNVVIESQESFAIENIIDFFFSVTFEKEDGSADPHTLLVRKRGSMPPRVIVEPFLDLYGGRLAEYARTPSEKGGVFYAIVCPLPSCSDPNIPERQKKITLKLLAHENSAEIAPAYTSRVSKIGEMLSSYDLSYGKARACVVLLGWNREENPSAPYLEALDIRACHWNP